MKIRMLWFIALMSLSVIFGLSPEAKAALMQIGTASYGNEPRNLVYEEGSGLVWLDYTSGANDWYGQMEWAAKLEGFLTYSLNPGVEINWAGGWRLPSAGPSPQTGYNQTSSEMGHLYYVSLGKIADGPLGVISPFTDIQVIASYWSSTLDPQAEYNAYVFYFRNGVQNIVSKENRFFLQEGLAVRSGNVSITPVPGPPTFLLLVSGLLSIFALGRRFKRYSMKAIS